MTKPNGSLWISLPQHGRPPAPPLLFPLPPLLVSLSDLQNDMGYLLIETLNNAGLNVCPWGMSLVTGHQLNWAWWFSQFFIHLIVHLSRQEFITWSVGTLWKTMAFLNSRYTISRQLFVLLLGSLPCLATFYVLSFCIRVQQSVPYFQPYSFLLRKDELTPYWRD